jgi:hypothetical protein
MNVWLTFFIAPVVYLTQLSGMFALVPWACATQHGAVLHGINALALVVCVCATGRAMFVRLAQQDATDDSSEGITARRRFIAVVGAYLGVLICVALVAQWLTVWFIPPCLS